MNMPHTSDREIPAVTAFAAEPLAPLDILFNALAAALEPDEAKGWKAYRALLHSEQLSSAISEKTWRTMNYSTLRRKARLYLEDDGKPAYKLAYSEGVAPTSLKLFIFNEKSEVPTPCTLKPDATQQNAWRISLCSL